MRPSNINEFYLMLSGKYSANILLPLMCISIILVPLYFLCDDSHLNKTVLHESLKSVDFKVSCMAVILAAIPAFIDLLLDSWIILSSTFQNAKPNFSWFSRALICISQLTMGVTFVTLNGGFNDSSTFLPTSTFILFHFSHRLVIAGCLAYNLCLCNPVIFPAWHTYAVTLAYSTASVSAYSRVYLLDNSFETFNHVIYYSSMTFIQFFLFYWLYQLWRNRWDCSAVINNYASLLHIGVYLILISGYLLALFSKLFLLKFYFPLVNSTPIWISYFMYSVAAYMMFLGIVPGRIARMETAAAKDKIIDTKKAYVRFISHEMRTPLNTVFMGLKVSLSQVPADDLYLSPQERDRREVLEDTSRACDAALEILNDLLLYDKLEDHMLVLNRQETSIYELVSSAVCMFSAQLREKNITLVLNMGENVAASSSIRRSDTVVLDKQKISQVLRNLLSNAIKFTEEGGSVYVTAYFETSTDSDTAQAVSNKLNSQSPRRICAATSRLISSLPTFFLAKIHESENYSMRIAQSETGEADKCMIEIVDTGKLVTAGEESGLLVVQVRDTGAGISHENQQRLFKEVIQFSPEKLQGGGGSGLGLHISHGIVGMHQGHLQVHSEGEGLGSTFTLKLPMTRRVGMPAYSSAADFPLQNLVGSPLHGSRWNPSSQSCLQMDEFKDSDTQLIKSVSEMSEMTPPYPIFSTQPRIFGDENCNDDVATATTALLKDHNCSSTPKSPSQKSLVNLNSRQLRVNSGDSGRTDGPTGSSAKSLYSAPGGTDSSKSFKSLKEEANDGRHLLHVLIVDDSKMNRKMLAKSIYQICSFEEAEDGQVAVEKVVKRIGVPGVDEGEIVSDGKRPFDAILMDFMMPRMDGPTATREIIRAGYQGLVIGVTGNAMQADIDHFLASGAVSVLIKPLDMTKLVQVFGNLLEPSQL